MLRRAGLGLLVGAILMAPSVSSAAPALVFDIGQLISGVQIFPEAA